MRSTRLHTCIKRSAIVVAFLVLFCPLSRASQTELPRTESDDAPKPVLDFAREIERTMNAGDHSFFDRAVDVDAIVNESIKGYDVSERVKEEFVRGVKVSFKLGEQICRTIQSEGSYKFLRFHTVDDRPRLLFRMVSESGFNYHDMFLAGSDESDLRIIDIYVLLTAENLSTTLRRGLLPVLASQHKGFVEKLVGGESDYVKNLSKIQEMQRLGKAGNPRDALRIYEQFPASLKKDKNMLILRFTLAAQVSEEESLKAVEAFRAAYPSDPCLDIMALDALFLNGKYPEALAGLDRVEKTIGQDAYIDFLRANLHFAAGDTEKAKLWAGKSIKSEPSLAEPYWTLVEVSLKEKDYKETVRLLTMIEQTLGIAIGDLMNLDGFAEFVKSLEYTAWMNTRRGK